MIIGGKGEMFQSSNIDFEDNITIVNPKQAAFYWGAKGIRPVHIFPSRDINTNDPIIVFVFKRSATKEAWREWQDRR